MRTESRLHSARHSLGALLVASALLAGSLLCLAQANGGAPAAKGPVSKFTFGTPTSVTRAGTG